MVVRSPNRAEEDRYFGFCSHVVQPGDICCKVDLRGWLFPFLSSRPVSFFFFLFFGSNINLKNIIGMDVLFLTPLGVL